MNDVTEISKSKFLDQMEVALSQGETQECPVAHHFGPGIYIRECHMRAGLIVLGHAHKEPCMNILVKGKIRVLKDGEIVEMTAPMTYLGGKGRKIAIILEDVVWQNVWATDETDVAKLEEMFVKKLSDEDKLEIMREMTERLT